MLSQSLSHSHTLSLPFSHDISTRFSMFILLSLSCSFYLSILLCLSPISLFLSLFLFHSPLLSHTHSVYPCLTNSHTLDLSHSLYPYLSFSCALAVASSVSITLLPILLSLFLTFILSIPLTCCSLSLFYYLSDFLPIS